MGKLFRNQPGAHPSPEHERVYGIYEKLYTVNDFIAALLFLVGSIMFFYKSLEIPAIWCFTIGSVNFMLRPTIKLTREYHLSRLPLPGDDPRLASLRHP